MPSSLLYCLFFGHAPESHIATAVAAVGEVGTEERVVLRFGMAHALHELGLVLIEADDGRVVRCILVLLPYSLLVPPCVTFGFSFFVPVGGQST
jgi:hypothetical protein